MTASAWQPHLETSTELLDPAPVAALAALLDDGLPTPGPGDPLPPLWHWVALPRWAASGVLGVDGHPRRGSFLPPVDLPRRMFAGGEIRFHAPLLVGSTVRREAEVISVSEKKGRSGALVVVDVQIRLFDDTGELAVEETQNLIYREAAPALERPAALPENTVPGPPMHRTADNAWELRTDPSLLARFSAATANTHRIHYDWPYATGVEGYPGLVVHGPLQAIALAEVHRLMGGSPARELRHRGRAPLFCGQPARLLATEVPDGVALELFGPGGESAGPNATVDLITD
ncbi:HTD2 family dehydratase [Nocardia fluminea]|uniref:Mesaconyl-C4-CoA hydratase n=1 Tax=Nocardia fluminea TaxID=134984 RepID=A0A2N3WXT5_9NOCA|nr:MaoC family dehydratase N-terminal domain-containing protein [Nocardia fluminea]PKV98670.1 mesaconyl-C4-CoA hydratase [Nocardia fluminea]